MKQLINTKELCKQIRYYGNSGFLIWTKEKDQNFITNRHFLVRFDEVPREVLAALFSVFYKLPEVGETMVSHFGAIQDSPKPISFSFYQPDKQDTEGEVTPFMRDMGRKLLTRVIKFPGNHAYVNESYAKLSAEIEGLVKGSNLPNSPIYFADGDLLILPYRITENSKDAIELLGDELNATTNTP